MVVERGGRSRGDTPPQAGMMSDNSEDEFETGGAGGDGGSDQGNMGLMAVSRVGDVLGDQGNMGLMAVSIGWEMF